MHDGPLIFSIFLIFTGAAILSTLALYFRQSMLVAYMLLGVILGPWGLKLVAQATTISTIGDVGIIFLLFLLGLHLPPQKLIHMLKKISVVGVVSSLIFMSIGYVIGILFHLSSIGALVLGASMMFSSTIIGIKLLPTTILHHQHTGEVMISVLLLQDIIAIFTLLLLFSGAHHGQVLRSIALVLAGFPLVCIVAYLVQRFVIIKLLLKFDRVREYMFMLAIAWCLTLSQLASLVHLSAEIGAFIAGVTLASSPVSLYIAESLKPIRDFFLVMFFFSVGASFNLNYLPQVWLPALCLAVSMMLIKPWVFRWLLASVGEDKSVAWEVGVRLAQVSEFSLIIAYMAQNIHLIDPKVSYLIQATTMLTFMVSSYWVVMRYPTPLAFTSKMRQD